MRVNSRTFRGRGQTGARGRVHVAMRGSSPEEQRVLCRWDLRKLILMCPCRTQSKTEQAPMGSVHGPAPGHVPWAAPAPWHDFLKGNNSKAFFPISNAPYFPLYFMLINAKLSFYPLFLSQELQQNQPKANAQLGKLLSKFGDITSEREQ